MAPRAGSGRLATLAIVLGTALAVLAGGVLVVGRRPSGPTHPAAWDARVAELVAFVETERGLTFKHPVTIDFVTEDDLAARSAVDRAELTAKDRAYWATQARVMRALGLARGPVDLLDEQNSLLSEGVLAFYEPGPRRIVAPVGILTPHQRATLVHELTHALQDQHFDIGRDIDDPGAAAAFRALIEGDAERVENAYVAQLPAADRARLQAEVGSKYEAFEQSTATISAALDALFQAPYVLGTSMTAALVAIDGPKGVNAAFRSPPVSEEAFLDPIHYRGNGKVIGVDAPRTVAGEDVVDEGTVGALGWYLLLSEATDMGTALNAAFGWGGDAYVAVDDGRDLCVRVAYRGDTAADNDEMAAALQRWAAAAPEARREVAVRGADVHVTACDPGPDSPTPLAGTATEALLGPRVVTDVARELHESGATFAEGRCIGMGFVAGLTPTALQALWSAPEGDGPAMAEVSSRLTAAAATCRANPR